jgi:hypothetical protein
MSIVIKTIKQNRINKAKICLYKLILNWLTKILNYNYNIVLLFIYIIFFLTDRNLIYKNIQKFI